ncbi:MAG TPA: hypothetical protein VL263_03815 [Vicinamibacterales bacterium]|nr:hypothetical protein [Vicinamibacterales bacterium]
MALGSSNRRSGRARAVMVACVGLLFAARPGTQGPRDLPPLPEPRIGAIDAPEMREQWHSLALAEGEPLSFRQEPPLLLPRDDHGTRLSDFSVAGDVARVRFDRWNQQTQSYEAETWERDRTDTIGGRLVSIFSPTWPPAVIQSRLATARVGLDRPFLFLGMFRGPADGPNVDRGVYLRVGNSLARPVEIVRVDDTVQYSSHVVNLVVPGFGTERLAADLDLEPVARKFYEHFEDSYEVLAVTPEAAILDRYAAFHRIVQNQVDGIGRPRTARFAAYGSAGTLLGVELNYNAYLLTNDTSTHELTHIWSHAFDWGRIAGIARAGHEPASHAPLMTGGESQVGAVLEATRRAVVRADGTAAIERVTGLGRQHPLDLYAMGLIGPAEVPEWFVFGEQGQFDPSTSSAPPPGTSITGPSRRVSINDVMAIHGPRSGPVLSTLRRASIVVSRDRLISGEEMAYWNYFAARLEDPTGSGIPSYEGEPSFEVTTNRRIDVRSDIRPRNGPAVSQPHDVDPAAFGTTDCRGIELTQAPRARVRVAERFTVAGRVTARDRSDFDEVLLRFWPGTGEESRAVRVFRDVSRSGTFNIDVEMRDGQDGFYSAELFLFWPGAGSQYARCTLSPMVVLPPAR